MKPAKQIMLIVLLLIVSIGLFSIRFLYVDNNSSDIELSNDTKAFDPSDQQNITFISDYLNIKINLKDYHILTNQEAITYLGLDKDYYNNSVEEILENGDTYYELIASFNDNSFINIIVSKPELISTVKDLETLYDEKEIDLLTNDYIAKRFTNISIKPHTIEYLKEDRFILDTSYLDQDNNPVFIRDIYISNDPYQGIIKLISNSINNFDLIEERISIYEEKD